MKNKLQFNVDDLDKYTVEELRQQVDEAIGQVCENEMTTYNEPSDNRRSHYYY